MWRHCRATCLETPSRREWTPRIKTQNRTPLGRSSSGWRLPLLGPPLALPCSPGCSCSALDLRTCGWGSTRTWCVVDPVHTHIRSNACCTPSHPPARTHARTHVWTRTRTDSSIHTRTRSRARVHTPAPMALSVSSQQLDAHSLLSRLGPDSRLVGLTDVLFISFSTDAPTQAADWGGDRGGGICAGRNPRADLLLCRVARRMPVRHLQPFLPSPFAPFAQCVTLQQPRVKRMCEDRNLWRPDHHCCVLS